MSTVLTPDGFTVTADDVRCHFEGVLEEFPQYNRSATINMALAIVVQWVATLFGLLA